MIDFTRAQLTHFYVGFVGNKGLGEELTLSQNEFILSDDFLKETLMRYFTGAFKTDIYYQFKGKVDVSLASVANACEDVFGNQMLFAEKLKDIGHHLYNQSIHPKINGGDFFGCYFTDVMLDGELCDAIGLFKCENKETFLKVYQHLDEFEVNYENGININKLDKGCLVFNTDKNNGYKLSVVDNNNKYAECAAYWEEDFLNVKLKSNAYYHTKNFMDMSRGFCEEVLTEANNVDKQNQMMMLNKSASYFKDKNHVTVKDFEKEVLVEPEVISAFKDYRANYNDKLNLTAVEEFDVSNTAVKKNAKYMRSIVKLDKNFHIYIHSKHEYIERGFDEERGLKYYKLYYVTES
jgi:hypothetical protein